MVLVALVARVHLDHAVGAVRVQTKSGRDEAVALGILKDLVAALRVAVGGAGVLARFTAHVVEAEVQVDVDDLEIKASERFQQEVKVTRFRAPGAYGSDVVEVDGNGRFRVDIVQVPFEGLAVERLAELDALAQVAGVDPVQLGYDLVEVAGVLVGPDVDEPTVVLEDDLIGAAGELVRRLLAEHMAHVGTRQDQQRASAHPDLRLS